MRLLGLLLLISVAVACGDDNPSGTPTLSVATTALQTTSPSSVETTGTARNAASVATAVSPAHGSVTVRLDGSDVTIAYTPTSDYAGRDAFALVAANDGAVSEPLAFTVEVFSNGNTAPELVAPPSTIDCGVEETVAIALTATDRDYPAQALTFEVTGGSCPSVLAFADNTLRGPCPLTGVACSIDYRVTDGSAAVAAQLTVAPNVRYVALGASGDGTSWASAYPTLEAAAGSTLPVLVKNDAFTGVSLSFTNADAVFYGGFNGDEVVYAPADVGRLTQVTGTGPLITINGGNVTLVGFAFRDVASGGAINAANASLTVRDSVFAGNRAGSGAAIAASGPAGALTVDNVIFHDNIATSVGNITSGGAIVTSVRTVRIRGSMFAENAALARPGAVGLNGAEAAGGALFVNGAQELTIADSSFFANSAVGGVGAAGQAVTPQAGGRVGNPGTDGGNGQGGAVVIVGVESSAITNTVFLSNAVVGGAGGTGGAAGANTTTNGAGAPGGSGGNSGSALGAAIYGGGDAAVWTGVTFADNAATGGAGGVGGRGGAPGSGNANGGTGGSGGSGGLASGGAGSITAFMLSGVHLSLDDNRAIAGLAGSGGAGAAGSGSGAAGASGASGSSSAAEGSALAVSGGAYILANSAFVPGDITSLLGATVDTQGACNEASFGQLAGGELLVATTSACVDAGTAALAGDYPWSMLFNNASFALDTGSPDAGAHYALDTAIRSYDYEPSTLHIENAHAADCRVFVLADNSTRAFTDDGDVTFPAGAVGIVRCGSSFVLVDTN